MVGAWGNAPGGGPWCAPPRPKAPILRLSTRRQRVLTQRLGAPDLPPTDAAAMLSGAAGADVEGRRVMYGSFVRMMGLTVKQRLKAAWVSLSLSLSVSVSVSVSVSLSLCSPLSMFLLMFVS